MSIKDALRSLFQKSPEVVQEKTDAGKWIGGTVVRGFGCARHTLKKQMPFFSQVFPEVSGCHPGTLNVNLDVALVYTRPDVFIPNIPWENGLIESFEFYRILFKEEGEVMTDSAWIYRALSSPHILNPCHIEILAKSILPARIGNRVSIMFLERNLEPLSYLVVR